MVLINSTSIEDGERGAAEKDDVPINIVGGPAYPYYCFELTIISKIRTKMLFKFNLLYKNKKIHSWN